jgi:hypothetical protein
MIVSFTKLVASISYFESCQKTLTTSVRINQLKELQTRLREQCLTFSQMSVKPEEAIVTLVTKTTPILVTPSNSSFQDFCGYYG